MDGNFSESSFSPLAQTSFQKVAVLRACFNTCLIAVLILVYIDREEGVILRVAAELVT